MPRQLVSYFGNRYLDHFQRDLEEIVEHGFNCIVHCATEADLEWGLSRLGEIFAATKEAGMECWADPWGLGGVFGGEAHSGFLGRNPDALQRSNTGETLPHACLRNPGFLRFVREWVDAMASAGAETIFWDEPHVATTAPGRWACACEFCREAFGGPFPETLTDEVLDFRIRTSIVFLDEMSKRAAGKGLRNSVCLYPLEEEDARSMGIPPLLEVARLEAVGDVGVDPYPVFRMARPLSEFDAEEFVGGWAKRLGEVASETGVTVHNWVQGFLLPEGFEYLVEECAEASRRNGVPDLGFWGFRAAEATSLISPGDASKVWEVAKRVFGSEGRRDHL